MKRNWSSKLTPIVAWLNLNGKCLIRPVPVWIRDLCTSLHLTKFCCLTSCYLDGCLSTVYEHLHGSDTQRDKHTLMITNSLDVNMKSWVLTITSNSPWWIRMTLKAFMINFIPLLFVCRYRCRWTRQDNHRHQWQHHLLDQEDGEGEGSGWGAIQ